MHKTNFLTRLTILTLIVSLFLCFIGVTWGRIDFNSLLSIFPFDRLSKLSTFPISAPMCEDTPTPENTPTPEINSNDIESPVKWEVIPQKYNIVRIPIRKADDQKKYGDVHSRIASGGFSIKRRTSGISPDVVRFVFDKRAEIIGILVSIDYSNSDVTLFEFEARINVPNSGYGNADPSDALIHTSYVCPSWEYCNRHTDEHIWFGENSGIEVGPREWISFGAWMTNENTSNVEVDPEFIVWYRWLE